VNQDKKIVTAAEFVQEQQSRQSWRSEMHQHVQVQGRINDKVGRTFEQLFGFITEVGTKGLNTHYTGQVLIHTLIKKGIVTLEELHATEQELKAEIEAQKASSGADTTGTPESTSGTSERHDGPDGFSDPESDGLRTSERPSGAD
jgi:hypothetical protein